MRDLAQWVLRSILSDVRSAKPALTHFHTYRTTRCFLSKPKIKFPWTPMKGHIIVVFLRYLSYIRTFRRSFTRIMELGKPHSLFSSVLSYVGEDCATSRFANAEYGRVNL